MNHKNNNIKLIVITASTLFLSSCMVNDENTDVGYQTYSYDARQPYTQMDYSYTNYNYNYKNYTGTAVSVPNSYHVGAAHSPVSFKDRDKEWVNSQNPQGYTIEVADDEKAAKVAQKLYKAPKNDRRAQVQYQRDGKNYYKGLYGNYDNPQDAQKALDAMPADIKQGAEIKNWGAVKGNLNE